jgi:hypothetical protein
MGRRQGSREATCEWCWGKNHLLKKTNNQKEKMEHSTKEDVAKKSDQ